MNSKPIVVDCGTYRSPLKSDLTVGTLVARSVSTGQALPLAHVKQLFEAGRRFAFEQLVHSPGYLIFSECVPGGTTTALAVLTALGIEADSLVSSSLPTGASLRTQVVHEGLLALKHHTNVNASGEVEPEALDSLALDSAALDHVSSDPFLALGAFGDPMQPFVAGAALEAANHIPVILGGGSQMLAVYHICDRLSAFLEIPFKRENIFVITTKWISGDANSNTRRLSELLKAPFFASNPDFKLSRFAGLQAYEEGHVKEGVGAGALMAAATLQRQLTPGQLMVAIDDSYDEIVLSANATRSGTGFLALSSGN